MISNTIQLHLEAVGQHLLPAALQLRDETDDHILRVCRTMLHDVLHHVVQPKCTMVDNLVFRNYFAEKRNTAFRW